MPVCHVTGDVPLNNMVIISLVVDQLLKFLLVMFALSCEKNSTETPADLQYEQRPATTHKSLRQQWSLKSSWKANGRASSCGLLLFHSPTSQH